MAREWNADLGRFVPERLGGDGVMSFGKCKKCSGHLDRVEYNDGFGLCRLCQPSRNNDEIERLQQALAAELAKVAALIGENTSLKINWNAERDARRMWQRSAETHRAVEKTNGENNMGYEQSDDVTAAEIDIDRLTVGLRAALEHIGRLQDMVWEERGCEGVFGSSCLTTNLPPEEPNGCMWSNGDHCMAIGPGGRWICARHPDDRERLEKALHQCPQCGEPVTGTTSERIQVMCPQGTGCRDESR